MSFSVDRRLLVDELELIQSVVEKRTTLPHLEHALVEASNRAVRLSATNLETTIITEIEAQAESSFAVLLPAKKLFEAVRAMNSERVKFSLVADKREVLLEDGRTFFRFFLRHDTDDFPLIPPAHKRGIAISNEVLTSCIQLTSFAASDESFRPNISGAKFESNGKRLRMVTTDGYRLAMIEKEVESAAFDVTIPKRAIDKLLRIVTKEKKDGECVMSENEGLLYFSTAKRRLITRKIDGNYPNYEEIIARRGSFSAEFDAHQMREAIRRVSLLSDEANRQVKLKFENNSIQVSSESERYGNAKDEIGAAYNGLPAEIRFNAQYLQDFFNVLCSSEIKDKTVKFSFTDGASQATITPKDSNDKYIYVVMPIR